MHWISSKFQKIVIVNYYISQRKVYVVLFLIQKMKRGREEEVFELEDEIIDTPIASTEHAIAELANIAQELSMITSECVLQKYQEKPNVSVCNDAKIMYGELNNFCMRLRSLRHKAHRLLVPFDFDTCCGGLFTQTESLRDNYKSVVNAAERATRWMKPLR